MRGHNYDVNERTSIEHIPRLATLGELAGLVERKNGTYVRYSKGPDADRSTSRDYESGLDLPGLSANPLTPEKWWTRPLREWLARQLCNYVHLSEEAPDDRIAWVLTGPVVARGPDNEPLIDPVTPVAVLDDHVVEEAKSLYKERFDVGRDSTG